MKKATKNNSNTQTKHKNRRINKRILTTLVVPLILVITLMVQNMSAFAAPAAYTVPGYDYGSTKETGEWNTAKKTFTKCRRKAPCFSNGDIRRPPFISFLKVI